MISLDDFLDAVSRRHNDVIPLPAIRRVSGNDFVFQQDSAPTHRTAHVQQFKCCVKKRQTFFLTSNLWPPNSPDLSLLKYEIWAVMQHRVYPRLIHGVDKILKRRLVDVYSTVLSSRVLTRLLTSGKEDIVRLSMLKEDISSTACELTTLILSISVP